MQVIIALLLLALVYACFKIATRLGDIAGCLRAIAIHRGRSAAAPEASTSEGQTPVEDAPEEPEAEVTDPGDPPQDEDADVPPSEEAPEDAPPPMPETVAAGPPVVAELVRRGFVVWLDEKPDPDTVGLGDLMFEACVPDPTDPDSPKFHCPRCAEYMFDFMESIERHAKKGRDWRWCEYGSVCLACGFIFEDENGDAHGFFGPLIEACNDMQEVFEMLDAGEVTDQRKLLAKREAVAMRQVLRLRSQRKEIEGDKPEDALAKVEPLERPPEKKDDDPA